MRLNAILVLSSACLDMWHHHASTSSSSKNPKPLSYLLLFLPDDLLARPPASSPLFVPVSSLGGPPPPLLHPQILDALVRGPQALVHPLNLLPQLLDPRIPHRERRPAPPRHFRHLPRLRLLRLLETLAQRPALRDRVGKLALQLRNDVLLGPQHPSPDLDLRVLGRHRVAVLALHPADHALQLVHVAHVSRHGALQPLHADLQLPDALLPPAEDLLDALQLVVERPHRGHPRAKLLPERELQLVVLVDRGLVLLGALREVSQARQEEVEDLAAVGGQWEGDLARRQVLELQTGGAEGGGEGAPGKPRALRDASRSSSAAVRSEAVRRRAAICDSIVARGSDEVSNGATGDSLSDKRPDSRVLVSFAISKRSDAKSSSSRSFSGSGKQACTPTSASGRASLVLLREDGVAGPAATGLVSGGVRNDDLTREGVLRTRSAIVASPNAVSSPTCTRSPHTDSASTVSVSMKSSAKGSLAASVQSKQLLSLAAAPADRSDSSPRSVSTSLSRAQMRSVSRMMVAFCSS
ncbi:hypothetical protein ColLi_10298 [Colletotrichum liriopes]|uniref:Uncharacterized protein n=1 Tax=Colletotrichum liriopes TaxID=708192 RepID=A0AA37LW07_9PEZI|nr:hypothetical protein ColLi_10298 [Colletotrichum liriopes]